MAPCKWGPYCQKQCNCGHTHDSLDEINAMWLSPEERQRINQVYQKYRSRIEYVIGRIYFISDIGIYMGRHL